MQDQEIETFLKGRRIDEVECLVPDMAGIARGKILPAQKFLEGMRKNGLRIPEDIFIQTVNGDYPEDSDDVTSASTRDVYLIPDTSTIRLVPWYDEPTAQVICDAYHFDGTERSEEHTSELQSLMRISYAVFCLKQKKKTKNNQSQTHL